MGKLGGSAHLKREAAPDFWPIHRKEFTWAVNPNPGPHPIRQCVPLLVAVREMLGLAKTRKEAKNIISQGKILVDGKAMRDERFPAGLMDVISIPEIKKDYRVLASERGLLLHQIGEDEASFKLCRIENKKTLTKGRVQLNLHDGRCVSINVQDAKSPTEDVYQTLNTLRIGIPDQEIFEHLRLEEGMQALFISGNNMGKYGIVTSVVEQAGQRRRGSLVTIADEKGQTFRTILDYVFVVGDKTPRISLAKPEV